MGALFFFLVFVVICVVLARSLGSDQSRTDSPHTRRSRPEPRPIDGVKAPAPTLRELRITGRAYVIDGDSIRIKNTEVRLFGIDAPEINHPYGRNAKHALLGLCRG